MNTFLRQELFLQSDLRRSVVDETNGGAAPLAQHDFSVIDLRVGQRAGSDENAPTRIFQRTIEPFN